MCASIEPISPYDHYSALNSIVDGNANSSRRTVSLSSGNMSDTSSISQVSNAAANGQWLSSQSTVAQPPPTPTSSATPLSSKWKRDTTTINITVPAHAALLLKYYFDRCDLRSFQSSQHEDGDRFILDFSRP